MSQATICFFFIMVLYSKKLRGRFTKQSKLAWGCNSINAPRGVESGYPPREMQIWKASSRNQAEPMIIRYSVNNKDANWVKTRVGYRNPVPTWHRYLWNRYVPNRIRTQISVPHFGAMPVRSVEMFVLCFSKTDVRSIITGTTHAK